MFVGDIRHQLQMRLVQLLFMLLIGDLPRFSAIPKIVERHLHTQKLTQNHKQVGFPLWESEMASSFWGPHGSLNTYSPVLCGNWVSDFDPHFSADPLALGKCF